MIEFLVNGKLWDITTVSYCDGELKSYRRKNDKIYEAVFDKADFIEKYKPHFDKMTDFFKEDDAEFNDYIPPYTGCTGYPSLEEIIDEPSGEGLDYLASFGWREIMRLYGNPHLWNEPRAIYYIETLDKITLDGDKIIISGKINLANRIGIDTVTTRDENLVW
jgi:hypothetical protein